jgi:predicted component of type VI protein secretion system
VLPLVIQIERISEGRTLTRAFHESPVRIGRSPFAGLRLPDPFISEWQAVVHFHDERTIYLDLGSKNPTRIRGRVVQRNVEVELDEHSDVCIGSLRLHFHRAESLDRAPRSSLDRETVLAPSPWTLTEQPTSINLIEPSTVRVCVPVALRERSARVDSELTLTAAAVPRATLPPLPPSATLLAAHRAYRDAGTAWLAAVRDEIERAAPAHRAARVRGLRTRFPELMREPAFRDVALEASVDDGHVDVEHWLGRLCGTPDNAIAPEQCASALQRVEQLLEIFASAFIESRRGHQRARHKLGLDEAETSHTTLQQSEDPQAVLGYLLELGPSAAARSHELRRSLADFAMHPIALLSAVVEGARSVLGQLEPEHLQQSHSLALAPVPRTTVREPQAAPVGVWPYEARQLWQKLAAKHHDLMQTEQLARALFGPAFMRRYRAIADRAVAVARVADSR